MPRSGSYRDDCGASAVEYSLIAVAIAAILVVVIFAIGRFSATAYDDTCSSLASGEFSATHSCP